MVSNLLGADCSTYEEQVKNRYGDAIPPNTILRNKTALNLPLSNNVVLMKQIENYCDNDIISISSIANKRFSTSLELVGDWLNLSSTIIILVLIVFFRKSQVNFFLNSSSKSI